MPSLEKSKSLDGLRLFNEKADRLLSSKFWKTFLREGTGISIRFYRKGTITVTRRGPDQDEIEAFILTLRFFVQDNETSSFRNLADAYEILPISQEAKQEFSNARDALNSYLDSSLPFKVTLYGKTYTNREILEVFVYGGFAHANPEKKELFDKWMEIKIDKQTLTNALVDILIDIMRTIKYVKELNTKVIHEIEKQKNRE